jgi:hypothetical protein
MNYAKTILISVLGSIQTDKRNLIEGNSKIKDEFFKATDDEINEIFQNLKLKEEDLIDAIKLIESSLET